MGGRRLRPGLERGAGSGGGGGGAGGAGLSSFARALASSDWHTRERGLRGLERFLRARGAALPPAELRRLWRGLFYCFWHADLAPVQAALAERLAGFLRIDGDEDEEGGGAAAPPKKRARRGGKEEEEETAAAGGGSPVLEGDLAGRYLQAFMWTMAREWGGLDRHRLDKFMLLVREFLRAALQRLRAGGWDPAEATEVAEALAEALDPPGPGRQGSLGVALHLADILVDEIELACAPEGGAGGGGGSESGSDSGYGSGSDSEEGADLPEMIPADALTALLEPFVGCACRAPGTSMRARTSELFERLQERTMQGLRYLLSGRGARGGIPFIQLDARPLGEVMFEAAAAAETRQEDREVLYSLGPGFEKIHALQQDLVAGRGVDEDEDEDSEMDQEEEEEGLKEGLGGYTSPASTSSEEDAGDDGEPWEDASGSGSGSGEDLGEMGGMLDTMDAEEEEANREEEEEEAKRMERRSAKKERRAAKKAKKEAKHERKRKDEGTLGTPETPGGKKSVHFRLKKNMVREFLKTEKLACSPSGATPRKSALREGQAGSPLLPQFLKKWEAERERGAGAAPPTPPTRRWEGGGRGDRELSQPRHGRGRGRGRGRGGSPRGARGRSPRGRGRSPRGGRRGF